MSRKLECYPDNVSHPRSIPSIEQLRQRAAMQPLEAEFGRAALVEALRAEAAALRGRLQGGEAVADPAAEIERAVPSRLRSVFAPSLVPVINATGVIVHTNLGRAPLGRRAAQRAAAMATEYSNLEYDLAEGRRGRRDVHAESLLCRLTGAEAAVIVNNNAAAALVTLAALAAGREVIISRGELVEIGGGFRVPDVMAQSGASLREVGTTNRTRIADYAAAISDRTALILRVHPSNFTIEGFTERVELEELVALGRRFSVPVLEDVGSGYLGVPAGIPALAQEPVVGDSLQTGADLVMFSGDKLLGGPQAGVIVGSTALVAQVRRHPLMRALRADKMAYAALEATLEEYAAGRALLSVPVARMIAAAADEIGRRAEALASTLAASGLQVEILPGYSTIGGGSAAGSRLPTHLVALSVPTSRFEAALRVENPPVIARIEHDKVLIDLRTVAPEQDVLLSELIARAAATLFP
jgi:L-seryl-tRNA(Ser) seleniumtransferase